MSKSKAPVLEAKNLVKTYGRVIAIDGADLQLFPGEILAVVGDNGAGKSTMIKCLSGAEMPDGGSMELDGVPITFKRQKDSRDAGIETVYQTLGYHQLLILQQTYSLAVRFVKKEYLGFYLEC